MRPVLFEIPFPWASDGLLAIRGYGAMLALGFLTAILVAAWRARREGENPDHMYNAGVMALLGGILGARLFDVLEYSSTYPNWWQGFNVLGGLDPLWLLGGAALGAALSFLKIMPGWRESVRYRWLGVATWAVAAGLALGRAGFIREVRAVALASGTSPDQLPFSGFIDALMVTNGGLTAYGGMILAVLLVLAYLLYAWRRHGVNILKMLDILAPSLALGYAFGRMGCFLNGCCYGAPSGHLPWGFVWPEGSNPYQAYLPRLLELHLTAVPAIHPAQLYAVLNAVLMFLVLHLAFRHRWRNGLLLGAVFGLYAVTRFLLEFLRLDEAKQYLGHFSISQAVSIFTFGAVIIYFLILPHLKMSRLDWQPAGGSSGRSGHPNRRGPQPNHETASQSSPSSAAHQSRKARRRQNKK